MIYVVLCRTLRDTQRYDGAPSETFFDDSVHVRQLVVIFESREAIFANTINGLLCFVLTLGMEDHCEEERAQD